MFNFKDLGDMSKLAQQAKDLQKAQEENQLKILAALKEISQHLKEIKTLLSSK
ncbi:MAG: hypothetical protein JW734_09695 [Candidatus Omnitrophica bacterium]|nr:hypothetical protein [Candidatus Omnitrophota bacterium]